MGKKKLKKDMTCEGRSKQPLELLLAQLRNDNEMLRRMLAQTGVERDRLHVQIAEMELQKEAEERCSRTAMYAQLEHRVRLFKGMVSAAKQHIVAERRIKELEAEVACFKSVRIAS